MDLHNNNNSRLIRVFLIFTLQKFGPLYIIGTLNFLGGINILLISLFIFSRIVGAIGGFNQSQIQLLLGYSSINNLPGWDNLVKAVQCYELLGGKNT